MPRKANPALLKPLNVSADLEAVVGKGPMPAAKLSKNFGPTLKRTGCKTKPTKGTSTPTPS
jgi:hypothetical protein